MQVIIAERIQLHLCMLQHNIGLQLRCQGTSIKTKYNELMQHMQTVIDLNSVIFVLHWDQNTYMPRGGADARGRQLAVLQQTVHEKFTAPAVGQLLADLQPYEEDRPYDSDEAGQIRLARRQYEKQTRVPGEFMSRQAEHASRSFSAWTKARPENDFDSFRPYLEKGLELSLEYAEYLGGGEHLADPLLDQSDHGLTVDDVRRVFTALREEIVPLVAWVSSQPPLDDSCLWQHFPMPQQVEFSEDVIRAFGFDFERGRQDQTHHPFATKLAHGDVRITTRTRKNHPSWIQLPSATGCWKNT